MRMKRIPGGGKLHPKADIAPGTREKEVWAKQRAAIPCLVIVEEPADKIGEEAAKGQGAKS